MKQLLLSALLAAVLVPPNLRAQEAAPLRETQNFNREWKFQIGDHPGAEAVAFNDAKWEDIGLPHSFNMPYFAAGNAFYVGYGWYRKSFELSEKWAGKRLLLDFEGAFQDAEIFLNGKKVAAPAGEPTAIAEFSATGKLAQ